MPHPSLSTLAGLLVLALAPLAQAATINVSVTDAAGKPLADAVALLEPLAGKATVKPMAGVEIAQDKKHFAPRVTVVTVGTAVSFPNFDTVRHHVYSFSPVKTFELKLYAGVPNQPVVFDKPGMAVLGCNIHDRMAAWVVVSETAWFARSAAAGSARIGGVPPGPYRLRVWHPGLPVNGEAAPVALTVGSADIAHKVQLAVAAEPASAPGADRTHY